MVQIEYLRDESLYVGNCEEVIRVKSTEDIQSLINKDIFITAQGNRTGIAGAAVPEGGAVLSFASYHGFTGMEYRDGTYYLRMRAGTTLEEIHMALDKRYFEVEEWEDSDREVYANFRKDGKQFFPPDPTEKSATIGGMFATNASGPASYYYGKTGKYVEKVKVWMADGNCYEIQRGDCVFSSLGECKLPDGKTVRGQCAGEGSGIDILQIHSGKDFIDLLAGSEGMLGIVEEITVRIEPAPESCWTLILYFHKEQNALDFQDKLQGETSVHWSDCKLVALDYMDFVSLQMIAKGKEYNNTLKSVADFPKDAEAAVYLELNSADDEQTEEALYEVIDLFSQYEENEDWIWAASTNDEAEKFKILRHGIPESINTEIAGLKNQVSEIQKMALDLYMPNTSITESVQWIREIIQQEDKDGELLYAVFGHAGERIYHLNLIPRSVGQMEKGTVVFKAISKKCKEKGFYICGENGVGKIKKNLFALSVGGEQRSAMKSVKDVFDPDGRLNPKNAF